MRNCSAGSFALLGMLALPGLAAHADEVTICYNYGCYARAPVRLQRGAAGAAAAACSAAAADAQAERAAIAAVIGRMYAIAGEQTPVWRDKGGNYRRRRRERTDGLHRPFDQHHCLSPAAAGARLAAGSTTCWSRSAPALVLRRALGRAHPRAGNAAGCTSSTAGFSTTAIRRWCCRSRTGSPGKDDRDVAITKRIVVGMSGGVDSSVAALLLKRAGFEVVGLFMKNWEDDDDDAVLLHAPGPDRLRRGRRRDRHRSGGGEFRRRVQGARVREFLAEYSAGRTPNPDVLCNAEIKFKAFLDHALALGAGRIATGHYAQVRRAGRPLRAAQGRGREQGPELFPAPPRPGAARAHDVSAGAAEEDRGAPHREGGGAAGARQEGFDRHLFHRRAAVPRVPQPLPAAQARDRYARPRAG